jgi:hypothetical protein
MKLQNRRTLQTRILAVQGAGFLDEPTAKALIEENSADESNRAGFLWFCFYPPKFAGESGIRIFLQYWGGEALSRLHCNHPVRGSLLGTIGTPCVVIADVPIALLNSTHGLAIRLARQYFVNRGHEISEEIILEAYTKRPIQASAIRHVLRYPDPSFLDVTGCHEWRVPLGAPASESR